MYKKETDTHCDSTSVQISSVEQTIFSKLLDIHVSFV